MKKWYDDYDSTDWDSIHNWAEYRSISYDDIWGIDDIPNWSETLEWIKNIKEYTGGKNLWD